MSIKAQSVSFLLSQVRSSTTSLAGGKVYFYAAGTTTTKSVWIDRGKQVLASNPYTLDVNGTAQLFADGLYRVVIEDADEVVQFDRDGLPFYDLASNGMASISDYNGLADAVNSIGSTPTTLVVGQNQTITANIVFPDSLELMPINGAVINHGAHTIRYAGNTSRWPLKQIFAGTGLVTITGFISKSYALWTGGVDTTIAQDIAVAASAFVPRVSTLEARAALLETTVTDGTVNNADHLGGELGSALISRLAAVETGQAAGVVGYATQALLYADLVPADKVIAYVTADPAPAKNGTYTKTGATGAGSWVQSTFDRVAVVEGRTSALEFGQRSMESTAGLSNLNMFDLTRQVAPNIIDNATLLNAGSNYATDLFFITDKILVKPGQYTVSAIWGDAPAGRRAAVYDAAQDYIAAIDTTTFTVPANGAYVRFSVMKSGSWRKSMLVPGATLPADYIAYGADVPWLNSPSLRVTGIESVHGVTNLNLFDPNHHVAPNIIDNYSLHTAYQNYASALFFITDKIPVKPGQYTVSPMWGTAAAGYRAAVYTASQDYIEPIDTETFTVPAGGAYVRFSVLKSGAWQSSMLVPGASLPASYRPYGADLPWLHSGASAIGSWSGKTIAWYGTSIPAGWPHNDNQSVYSYATKAATALGALCLNYSVPNGVIRNAKASGAGMSGGRDILSFSRLASAVNYQVSMLDLIGTANDPDLFVFDYGINDIHEDVTDFNMFDAADPYSADIAKIAITSRDINTFIGAFNHSIDLLLAAKPRARFCIITHFSKDFVALNGALKLVQIQEALGEYWGVPVCSVYEKSGLRYAPVNTLAAYMSDSLHPANDATGQTVEMLTTVMSDFLSGIR